MALELLKKARKQGVSITLNNSKLRVETSGKPLSDELRAEIIKNKSALLVLLEKSDGIAMTISQPKIMAFSNKDNIRLPLSYSQQRLWFLDKLNQGSSEYNMVGSFNIDSDFDLEIARTTICKIIERHQILRTVYKEVDGKAYQFIKNDFDFNIKKHNLCAFTEEKQKAVIDQIINGDMNKAFTLSEDLLIRVNFILLDSKLDHEQGILTINIHHIASDGWSVDIFLKEFVTFYQAILKGEDGKLPDLPIQYSDYAIWQKEVMSKELLSPQLSYWKKQLNSLPKVHNLPLVSPRNEVKHKQGKMLSTRLDIDHCDNLFSLAKNLKMTPFMLSHAALALVLSNYSNSQDIVIGTPIANRKQSDLENLIGFFSNSLPIRVSTAFQTLKGFLINLRKAHIDLQENQDVPFELLVEREKMVRNLAYSPLFQIMLSSEMDYGVKELAQGHQNTLFETGLKTRTIEYTASKFDLEVNVVFSKYGISIYWLYDTSLFSEKMMVQMKKHFALVLQNLSQLSQATNVENIQLNEVLKDGHLYSPFLGGSLNTDNAHKDSKQLILPVNIQDKTNFHYEQPCSELISLDSQIEYWKKQLFEVPHVHNLTTKERGRENKFKLNTIRKKLPEQLLTSLFDIAKKNQLTPFMLLHGALSIVLSRHSNRHDIVIGTPVGHQFHYSPNLLKKLLINTLVLRVNTHHHQLSDYLAHVKSVNISAFKNKNVPFEQLIERLNIVQNSQIMPLVQIILTTNLEGDLSKALSKDKGITLWDRQNRDIKHTNNGFYDIHIDCKYSNSDFILEWDYNEGLFSKRQIEQLNSHLCKVLFSFSELLGSTIENEYFLNDVTMFSEDEVKKLLPQKIESDSDLCEEFCIHELFEEQVRLTPDAIAVISGNHELSYKVLNEKSNQLAHHLIEQHNLKPDSLVGICVERSVDMIIGLLAILKAGGGYVPLDPNYPKRRLSYILGDTNTEIVITSQGLLEALTDYEGCVIKLDTFFNDTEKFSDHTSLNIRTKVIGLKSNNLAYVIYTSGSTGKPKGVMVEHRNATSMLNWAKMEYDDAILSRTLASTSLNFDLSVFEIFAPLSTGGCCIIVKDILDLINEAPNVSLINTVPSAAKALLEQRAFPKKVKCINLAGEPLHSELVNKLLSEASGAKVYNLYGPSEDTTYSTFISYSAPVKESVSIGKVITNSYAYILNENLELVPYGALGELYLSGAGLARGYLEQPVLTAERFINNPYYEPKLPNNVKRLYKTGDLVRFLPSGNLQYVGRLDDQVKIHGFRIELGEIESNLRSIDTVDSSLVLAKTVADSKQLVAYLKPCHTASGIDQYSFIEQIKAQIECSLPNYMVPRIIILIKEWPLSPNGKIDQQALPAPDAASSQQVFLAPKSVIELALTQIWGELLQIDPANISVSANFFALGGHSLLTTRLHAQIRSRFNLDIPLHNLFEQQSLATLAEKIEKCHFRLAATLPDIEPINRPNGLAKMSFSQQRLWFIDQLQKGSPEYNIPIAFNVNGYFQLDIIERVFQTIIERHEVLRTVYVQHGDESLQQVRPIRNINFSVQHKDLCHLSCIELEEAIERLVVGDIYRPFDLSQDLMLRITYLKARENKGILLFNIHHIASDGWSMEVLTKEFFSLYDAYSNGLENPLAPLKVQYADYAHWLHENMDESRLAQQREYWVHKLSDMPNVHALPLEQSRPEVKSSRGQTAQSSLSAEIASDLQQIARRYQITPFMLFHGVLALLISRHSNCSDIVIGTPVANRAVSALEPLIGFFANTLVLRVKTEHPSISDYFKHIKNTHLEAQSNQDLPFEQLVDYLQAPRSQSHTPLFQIMLTMSSDFSGAINDEPIEQLNQSLQYTQYQSTQVASKFDLNIDCALSEKGVQIDWIYDESLFSSQYITKLNEHFCRLLTELANSTNKQVSVLEDLQMLSDGEKEFLVNTLNDTQYDYPTELCIHEIFESQVLLQPSSVAMTFDGESFTYNQLNERANQLAHFLKEHYDLKPNFVVGVCVERSPDMVICILAILKAGAAYLPLDIRLPKERLRYILSDTAPKVVLVQKRTSELLTSLNTDILSIDMKSDEYCRFSTYSGENISRKSLGLRAEDLSYVMYTSGSTGSPKGIKQTHKTVCNLVYSTAAQQGITHSLRTLNFTPYSFDVSVQELVTTWYTGSCLVGLNKEPKENMNELLDILI